MTRYKAGFMAGMVFFSTPGFADDLESILDEAAEKPAATAKKAGAPPKTHSAIYYILLTELKNPTPNQSEFIQLVEEGEWIQALLKFPLAFEGTPYQQTANGRALFALAHFNSGLPVAGVERFFQIANPGELHPEIRRMWSEAAPANHFVWDLANITWDKKFAEIFSPEIEFRIGTRDLNRLKDISALESLYSRLPTKSLERARAGWQLVIAHSLRNEIEPAAKTLAKLLKEEPLPVSRDLMDLTAARLLYQRALYAPAIKYYEKIGKNSEYWTDAQEEMSWAFIRKGEPQNALAVSKSLVTPAMVSQSGAEGFFVHSLAQLKICDYPGVIKSLGEFSKRFKTRNQELSTVATSTESPETAKVLAMLQEKKVSRAKIGKEARALPRMISRDERLFHFAQAAKHLQDEAAAAETVFAKSMALTGLQGYFDKLRKDALARSHTAAAAADGRVKELAKMEAREIQEILRKLHIVEAEVITQVSVAERVIAQSKEPVAEKKGTTGSKSRDTLEFPANAAGDEVWFDEIGNYRINVRKSCQAKGKST